MEKVNFTKDEREFFNEEANKFLIEDYWERRKIKDRIIYTKKGEIYPPKNFLEKPKKRNLPLSENIIKNIQDFFLIRNYTKRVEDDISITDVSDTFLIGAGIQYFRRCFWGNESLKKEKFFVPQPVVRTKYINHIREGTTSSFVNLTTSQISTSFHNHLMSLDDWFDLFSYLGLYLGDFNLEFISTERYGKGKKGNWAKTDGFSIKINYLDLDLGDAGYIRIPTKNNGNIDISDIGFGLERILWALYKTSSYFDLIGPKNETKYKRFQLIDSLRSSTLLGMSNIENSNPDAYNQFRKFTKIASQYYGMFDTFKLVNHYYNFWSKFITPKKDIFDTYDFLDKKISKEILNESRNL